MYSLYMQVNIAYLFHQVKIKRGKLYNIPRNERVCKICSLSQIEDSFSSYMFILRIMRKMCVK